MCLGPELTMGHLLTHDLCDPSSLWPITHMTRDSRLIFPVADTVAAIRTLQQMKQTVIVKKTFSIHLCSTHFSKNILMDWHWICMLMHLRQILCSGVTLVCTNLRVCIWLCRTFIHYTSHSSHQFFLLLSGMYKMLKHTVIAKSFSPLSPLYSSWSLMKVHNVCIGRKEIVVRAAFVFMSADNFGFNSLFGFCESFSATRFCRFCECTRAEADHVFTKCRLKLRSRKSYDEAVSQVATPLYDVQLTGVKSIVY